MEFSIQKFITPFIESQFPQFYLDEGPQFIAFVKAYYQWLESNGNVLNQTRSLPEYRDIDTTLDQFVQYFISEYLPYFPQDTAINARRLAKLMQPLYGTKSTPISYKFLFRILFTNPEKTIDFIPLLIFHK